MAASKHGVCASALVEFMQGVHKSDDVYKIALYSGNAQLDTRIKNYTAAGEVSGPGYMPGGQVLEGIQYEVHEGSDPYSCMGWSNSPRWENATIKVRRAVIYNASKGNKAIAVIDFGEDKASSAGPWFVKEGQLLNVIQIA